MTKPTTTCPGCSTTFTLEMSFGDMKHGYCRGCGGYIAECETDTYAYLIVKGTMGADGPTSTYFDISWKRDHHGNPGRRHGWFNPISGYVTQAG